MLATILAGASAPALTPDAAAQQAPSQDGSPVGDTQTSGPDDTVQRQDEASAVQPGEIIVTALKRGTRLQSTPLSISAVTSESLTNSGVQDIADLNSQVPSLDFVDGGPSNRRVVIRGIQAAGEPTVGVYYDETPVTGVVGASNDAGGSTPELRLFDVERVEVLRGPQGTLYGSGSMGGTLRVIYNKPSSKWEAGFDGSLSGTRNGGPNMEMSGLINVPIINHKIALRVVGFYKRNEGYIDNTYLGIDGINDAESYGGRALLRIKPTSNLTIDGAAYINRSSTDTPNWIKEVGKYKTDSRVRLPVTDDIDLYSLTAQWDIGGVTATAVGSYLDRDLATVSDTSRFITQVFGNRPLYDALCGGTCTVSGGRQITSYEEYLDFVNGQSPSALNPQQNQKVYTGEFRLSSSGEHVIDWTVGAFYSHRKTEVNNPQVEAQPENGILLDPPVVDTGRLIFDTLEQIAGFGEVTWNLTDKLSLTGGMRYFKYNKDVAGRTYAPSILVGAQITPLTRVSSKEDGTVFKGNVSYQATPDILFYATAAQGFRPGGVNQVLGLAQSLTPYQSDKLWNYEVGAKTSFFDRKVTLNGDVFQIDWSDIQVSGQTPNGAFSFITNAGSARVRGIELETTIRPITGLSITGNTSYLDAVLSTDQSNDQVRAPGLEGDRIPYVPEFSGGVSVQYTWPLINEIDGLMRADYSYTGGSYSAFRPGATYTRHIDSYSNVNMRAGIQSSDDWGAYVFVTNLFDSTEIVRASSSAIGVGLTSVTSARPRTIGLNLRKSF